MYASAGPASRAAQPAYRDLNGPAYSTTVLRWLVNKAQEWAESAAIAPVGSRPAALSRATCARKAAASRSDASWTMYPAPQVMLCCGTPRGYFTVWRGTGFLAGTGFFGATGFVVCCGFVLVAVAPVPALV